VYQLVKRVFDTTFTITQLIFHLVRQSKVSLPYPWFKYIELRQLGLKGNTETIIIIVDSLLNVCLPLCKGHSTFSQLYKRPGFISSFKLFYLST